ncbi:cytochrome d ubiquinol oxidase subunit II [Sporosarcina sp. P12(2017)]|uniref:cytochrome d ubiquinol oxidase subunit II n=1 Tax=unclassified Sporosarcina TaxID=2647733 RepID=UPI000C1721EE|nr:MULTISPECIES: cytochrome d ubiquinol oxidase subunit II [unclassified Sporosarcina]PIC58547.1 cytochrome d ubiquinol oxidase subunit II [Sporosarcina sp. P10]PIC61866.1 cytochrome d ubiquinol oxidase subunit II [Sporosarcina sp. P12(2017)]
MPLSDIWFILIAVLFIGFIFLEGFDFGVGMSTKFLARNDLEKRVVMNTIGPVWDANEVWLITAGGAMFAAFPHWYATAFSGFYLPFVVLLLAFIIRGVAFEFRNKVDSKAWVKTWDWAVFIGSILPPFLFGVFFTSLIRGLPIDGDMNMYASFTDFINVYTVIGGVTFVLLSYLHGLLFIGLKTVDELRERANAAARKVYALTGVFLVLFIIFTYLDTDAFTDHGAILIPMYSLAVVLYGLLFFFLKTKREGLSFTMTGLVLIIVMASFFIALFPNVMISSMDPAFNMSIADAASGDYSLKIMTIVAFTMVPIVLAYTIWSYYVFRKRLTGDKEHLEY